MRMNAVGHLSRLETLTKRISTIEQKLIGPDKDAMDLQNLLALQKEAYGRSMFEAIEPDDPMIAEYLALGMSKDQAILRVFEHRFGKVTLPSSAATHEVSVDDPMVEEYLSLGLTRDEAIMKVYVYRYGVPPPVSGAR
jgi:hypothetical protein